MSPAPSNPQPGDVPEVLYTAEEIAEVLKVDPKTVLNWAKAGIIPEAFRVGRTVRFSLEAVKASLDVNCAGEGRSVELAVQALKLVFGDDFPKLPNLDTGSITIDETTEIKRLCAIHAAALEELKTPQERFAYTEGALDAAKMAMIKDLKLKGSSEVLKVGTKSKPIRLVDGDHEISCKMDGIATGLKACFVKKVVVP